MNNKDSITKTNRTAVTQRREGYEREDYCCSKAENNPSNDTSSEYEWDDSELTEEEYLNLLRRTIHISDVPIGFERKNGQHENRTTSTRRIPHETVLEESEERYRPIKEYEKTVDECGLTSLFGKKTDIETITERLAKNIKALRERVYKTSFTDIAFNSDVTRQYIAQIESGKNARHLKRCAK